MTLKVIGAGFGRTGTLSTKAALEELGFGPCYHQFELRNNPAHGPIWGGAARGEPVHWEELFEGYQATVDWPGCRYYKELMVAFPDAKVLLNVRDPEKWYDSVLTTIYSQAMNTVRMHEAVGRRIREAASASLNTSLPQPQSHVARDHTQVCKSPIWDDTFSGRFEDRRHAIEVFNRHNEEVKRHVPPDRLLVYEVKEGWEPLCEFLSVEVPEGKSFPRLNDADAFLGNTFAARAARRLEEHQTEARYLDKVRTMTKSVFDAGVASRAAAMAAVWRKKRSSRSSSPVQSEPRATSTR